MYSYGGYQRIFNATSSVITWQVEYGPKWKKACALHWAELYKMEFGEEVRGCEACISKKRHVKKQATYP